MGIEIHFKNIYKTEDNKNVLIIYNISARHFIGIPIQKDKDKDKKFIPSINFYYDVKDIQDYKYMNLIAPLYIKGKPLQIKDSDFKCITKEIKNYYINQINIKISENIIDNLIFAKWVNDLFEINESKKCTIDIDNIKPHAIYWVNYGFGVGSELRKLRPAILWRYSKDKKMCTFIPLSSKCYEDLSYYHYDLSVINNSTAKIECLENFSYKRIVEPFRLKGRVVYINNKDIVSGEL